MSGISTQQRATAVTDPTTTETVAITIPFAGGVAANPSLANAPGVGSPCKLKISGNLNFAAGTAATALQLRCRRGTTVAGAQVGNTIQIPDAAVPDSVDFEFQDLTPGFAQAYVITMQQVSATGNGTATEIVASTQDFN